jgi:hypothetical protein
MAITASKPEGPVYETQVETQITAQPLPQTTVYAPGGASKGNEKVATPQGFIVLRIVQLIVAIVVIALTSYLVSNNYGVSFPVSRFPHHLHAQDWRGTRPSHSLCSLYGLNVLSHNHKLLWLENQAVLTILVEVYYIVAETAAPAIYNYIAILTLDSLLAIFWLSAMSDSAALRAAFNIPVDLIYYYKKREFVVAGNIYLDILTTDVAVAALELYV